MKQYIIGLTGWASVGKDTVASLLVTHLEFQALAFADALRAEIAEGFGIDPLHLSRPHLKNEPIGALRMALAPQDFLAYATAHMPDPPPRTAAGRLTEGWLQAPRSPRQIMQWWGTEYRRKQNPRYWTQAMLARLVQLQRMGYSRFVVTDVRFENEADMVHAAGGLIWQVTRPGIDGTSTAEGAHVSATSGAEFSPRAVIANTHDIRHLQQLVLGEFLALETGLSGLRVEVSA